MASVLKEKDAIHETIAKYCYHFDGGEFRKWLDLFTEDGIFDADETAGIHTGKVALRALVDGLTGRYEDQLLKQGDRWLFKNRKVHFDLVGDMN